MIDNFSDTDAEENEDVMKHDQDVSTSFKVLDFQCGFSKKCFSSKFNLRVHESKLKHKCTKCWNKFCTKSTLTAHSRNTHGIAFMCTKCGREFNVKQRQTHEL